MAGLSVGCGSSSRYKVLSTVFDGVPTPIPADAAGAAVAAAQDAGGRSRTIGTAHGPYAAKMCSACHESASSSALVAPREQLCFQCHELPKDKKYIHGPLASGGCMVCHDPHSSRNEFLLVTAASNSCFECHDRTSILATDVHEGAEGQCTTCHDAHMSDNPFLLR